MDLMYLPMVRGLSVKPCALDQTNNLASRCVDGQAKPQGISFQAFQTSRKACARRKDSKALQPVCTPTRGAQVKTPLDFLDWGSNFRTQICLSGLLSSVLGKALVRGAKTTART